jgi:hypothetical protein
MLFGCESDGPIREQKTINDKEITKWIVGRTSDGLILTADVTNAEKKDNFVRVRIWVYKSYGAWTSNAESLDSRGAFLRVNCDSRTVETEFETGPIEQSKNSLAYTIIGAICGIKSPKGLFYAMSYDNQNDYYEGWVTGDLEFNGNDQTSLKVNFYSMPWVPGTSLDSTNDLKYKYSYNVNCFEKIMTAAGGDIPGPSSHLNHLTNEKTFVRTDVINLKNKPTVMFYIPAIEKACSFAFANLDKISKKRDKAESKTKIIKPNSNLNEAKQKCKDLGFKEKTEKFGTCVLELTK